MKNYLTSLSLLAIGLTASAQSSVNKIDNPQMLRGSKRTEIVIPDINGYKALKGDFHLHTIFSDGSVMPNIRVEEAWRNGLDIIAITDHIEYRPYQELYKDADLNTSYELAIKRAQQMGIHLIKGTELTTDKPQGGHINALFITDANAMLRPKESPDLTQAVEAAVKQGAYLIWNHPGWAIDTCKMFDLNEKWVKEGKIKGVEVFNEKEYYPRVATWVQQLPLTPFANTDAHASIQDTYDDGVMQPYNIVLARENTMEAIKEAMFAGRVIAVFNGQACATPALLESLFKSCTKIEKLPYGDYKITNISDIPFQIKSKNLKTNLEANQSVRFKADGNFEVEVSNLHIDEAKNLTTLININNIK